MAIDMPDTDSYLNFIHTLFALRDMNELQVGLIEGKVCKSSDSTNFTMFDIFHVIAETGYSPGTGT